MTTKKIIILTDSSACIPEEIQRQLNIVVIPLWLIWDGQSYKDGIDIQPDAFYHRLRGSKTLPTSSQPSSQEFKTLFQTVATEADAIIAIMVSSRISGTYANAKVAAEELPGLNIHILDTLTCAMGLGLIVIEAARAAAEGKTVDEVVALAEQLRDSVYTLFAVDTLEYLFKGGRISGGKHLLGTALNIKPLLHFHEGQIKPLTQARSKKKALAQLIEIVAERMGGNQMVEAAVMDVDAGVEADQIAETLKDRFHPVRITRTGVSPVVGTHVGPGTVGISIFPVVKSN